MVKLSPEDVKEINRFRSLFPKEIEVRIHRSEDGGFFAEVLTFPGVITEADTFSELIEMVSDAAISYFEVPGKYAPFVANYLPTIELAQKLGIFPVIKQEQDLKLQLVS
ncbi:MAG: hypothetical protein US45_C0048G0006 [Candidatus Nomurabacteria bacterium GW2011_GWA1_37_20]|uniref:Uncharacterized protein n=2 Tax=Parcubacteria group TaxID=1794811 RepID=A0A0G0JPZ9_9BACT|nr:MAG: hypothetical protein US45_C0048G0006 [Candidatus Nomurabacteria bacterium GW2011_GWA1_37_20]KKS25815.1 MAG: hypothetical protein UU84_C0037G0008 [Candidatus Yanofskybacteria bacterium GW2011_GWC2_41_9]